MEKKVWRQPIPTNLEEEFGKDTRAFVLFLFLLYRAANGSYIDRQGNGTVFEVQRSQVVFGRNQYAKYLNVSPRTASRVLQRLASERLHHKVTLLVTSRYTLVTILNYDYYITFDQVDGQTAAQPVPVIGHHIDRKEYEKKKRPLKNMNINAGFEPASEIAKRQIRETLKRIEP